jgi:class 3 adenylate cyclase/predicted ATPase
VDFYTVLDQVVELVRSRGRVSHPALKTHFGLTDEQLEAVRSELRYAHAATITDDDRGLSLATVDESTASPDAERRQLTVLFCDLVDSTPLSRELDPEDFREVMRTYYETCRKVIDRFDGYIAQYLGDGLIVFFGYPQAHEDDAQRAVRAGLDIITAVTGVGAEMQIRYGVELAVRIGCHTGLVVVGEVVGEGRHELMAAGDTPNIAARLQGVANHNTLAIGPLTHQLVSGFFDCRSLGTPPLKGVATRMEVFQVLGENSARTRLEALGQTGLTPLVGRTVEKRTLSDIWADAANGRGRAVVVNGEAGIGKSRLVHALSERATAEGAWLIPCHGSPYHRDTALHPFVDLFERVVLGSESGDSPAAKTQRLTAFFTASGLPADDVLSDLCVLLSLPPPKGSGASVLPPDQQKQRTLGALQTIIDRRAAQQPVLLIVEDLHWVDPTTLDMLTMLVNDIADRRILALFTARPEFDNPWRDSRAVTVLDLARLTSAEAAELSRRVAGGKPLPDGVVSDVVSKTDGIPLFIEELTKTLLESDLLTEQHGRYELAAPLPPLAIPNTLHDSLMARLDRLSATKSLAQLGAVIGREFSFGLLQAVSPWQDTQLTDGLHQLVAGEFLYQQGVPPNATYRFKHALIQDAAYQSLLKSTRQRHHQRIAAAIESGQPETVVSRPELLAHHYTQAGLTEQAVPYWYAAARSALDRDANSEACNHATRGLELVAALPDGRARAERELALELVYGAAKAYVTGPNSAEDAFSRACDLARELGDAHALFPALAGLAYSQIVCGRMRRARSLAEEFLARAEPVQDRLILAIGHWLLAYAAWWQGDVTVACEHSRRCLSYYDPDLHLAGIAAYANNPGVVCGYLEPLSAWVLGYPTQASAGMERALVHARHLDHPQSLSVTLLFAAQLAQLRREPPAATMLAGQAMAISTEHGLHALTLWCLLPSGWAAAHQGDPEAAIADIGEAMARRRAFGMGAVWPWYLTLVAEAYGMTGQFDEAFRALDEAVEWVQRNDERLYAAEAHRIRGELLLSAPQPDPAQAELCFELALAVARDQQARSWELRAATSMARLWQQQGRRDDARGLLAPLFEWFTEGFDTPDLKDAEALLHTLS